MGRGLGFFIIPPVKKIKEVVQIGIGLEFGQQPDIQFGIAHNAIDPCIRIHIDNIFGHLKTPANIEYAKRVSDCPHGVRNINKR
jgi:hypothetical protein